MSSYAYASRSERVDAANIKGDVLVTIPASAQQVASHVFSLGTTFDEASGELVEGYLIVHPREGYGKPGGTPGNGKKDKGPVASSCYSYLAKSARWTEIEPWVVNAVNSYGMSHGSVFSILTDGIAKWEDAADGIVGNGVAIDILGEGALTSAALVADESSTDGLNEVYFAPLDQGTIGVTIVWGVFGGPPQARKLVEWDQVYNANYPWSDTGASDAMDFDNIATHELGHSVGMGDLYEAACASETMYGYSDYGETDKRDLNTGDIAGVSGLY